MKAPWMVMGIAVAALGLLVSQAGAANFVMSVQLAPGETGMVDHVGQVVNLNVYAAMTGSFIAGDGVNQVQGGLMSSNGGLLGNLLFALDSAFTQSGSSSGTAQTLDADTDKDVGGTSGAAAAGWVSAQAGANVYSAPDANGLKLIGTATFTVNPGLALGQETNLNWVYRIKSTVPNTFDNYKIGGQTFALAGNNTSLGVGTPVTIFTPEPATMAVLAIGGLGLLLRRKKSA